MTPEEKIVALREYLKIASEYIEAMELSLINEGLTGDIETYSEEYEMAKAKAEGKEN